MLTFSPISDGRTVLVRCMGAKPNTTKRPAREHWPAELELRMAPNNPLPSYKHTHAGISLGCTAELT